jgi:hypothetical protein
VSAQQEPRLRDLSSGKWYRAPNEFMDQLAPHIGVFPIAVYHLLCRRARDERVSGLTTSQIAKAVRCGRTKVFEALDELERRGAIRRVGRLGRTDYELLNLRLSAKAHPQSEAMDGRQSAMRTGRVHRTDESGSGGERPIRKVRPQDYKTPIPPTPLCKGGESRTIPAEEAVRSGQELKCSLKRELYDVPPNASQLATDDYDRYCRDVNFIGTGEGPIIVETADLELTRQGLHKYEARLAKIGRRVFEREVEFEVVYEGAAE